MQKQKGMTFIGLVLMVAGIVFIAVIGMKLVPAYIEYMSVKKIITKMGTSGELANMSTKEIQTSFDKSASVGYVTVVGGKDLVITPNEAGGKDIELEYQVVIPLMGNVSALLDFKAATKK